MTQIILLSLALFVVIITAAAFYFKSSFIKFISIFLLFILANAVYFSLDGVKGWPAEEKRAVKGILAAVIISPPNSEDDGAIFISLYPTTPIKWYEYEYYRRAPKTYYIEYSNDRAAKFDKAKKALEAGQEVRINGIPSKESKDGDGQGEGMISGLVSMFEKIISTQRDTYKPEVPDIEIMKRSAAPQKGKTQ